MLLGAVLIVALLGVSGCDKEEVGKEADNRLTVETALVKQESIRKVTYSGTPKGQMK